MGIFSRNKHYVTPSGKIYDLFSDMAKQPHLLIAGATGSGKSVVVNGIVYNLLHRGPGSLGLILIDPKRTELADYKSVPHCLKYATEPNEWIEALDLALSVTEERFKEMQKRREKIYSGGDIYVIIDELAFLMTTKKKEALPRIQRLGMIARAAKVHMIVCTQTVKADILSTTITCNFDSRVALHTATALQSRMIMGVNGCEDLPRYGQGFFCVPGSSDLYNIPKYSDSDFDRVLDWWTSKKCIA